MNGCGSLDALKGPVDGGDGKSPGFFRLCLQEWLVELHHVRSRCKQVLDLIVERGRAIHRDRNLVLVVLVEELLRHGEWTRDGDPDRPVRLRAKEGHVAHLDRSRPPQFSDDAGHDLHPSGRARRHLGRIVAIHPFKRGRKSIGVAFPPNFTVGDDIDSRALLIADRENCCVVLRLVEQGSFHSPKVARTGSRWDDVGQAPSVDQPVRLRIAPDQGRWQQHVWSCHALIPSHIAPSAPCILMLCAVSARRASAIEVMQTAVTQPINPAVNGKCLSALPSAPDYR